MAPMSLPPGFRFHPTDDELVAYYLDRKINGRVIELEIIPEVDLYKCEPWDLPDKSFLPSKDMEWYFYSPRDRKYPNGSRTNRATRGGYWKATGKDRPVYSRKKPIGMKKTLVYYKGRAPHGIRSNWVMHEYRLLILDSSNPTISSPPLKDSYALCRVFKKDMNITKTKKEARHLPRGNETKNLEEEIIRADSMMTPTHGRRYSEDDIIVDEICADDSKSPSESSSSEFIEALPTHLQIHQVGSDETSTSTTTTSRFYSTTFNGDECLNSSVFQEMRSPNYMGICTPALSLEDFPQMDIVEEKQPELLEKHREFCLNNYSSSSGTLTGCSSNILDEIYSLCSWDDDTSNQFSTY